MPTFETTCRVCGKRKWPTLRERPTSYVCVMCSTFGVERVVARRQAGRTARLTLLRGSQTRFPGDAKGGTAG